MRLRKSFAAAFGVLLLVSAYLGLLPSTRSTIPRFKQSDKVLHFITLFALTICFYWILETNRRRNLQLTLFVCPFALALGSEIVQGFLPNGRDFDPYDVIANVAGSLLALALCTWYHKRMLERKRKGKNYQVVPGEDDDRDIELGEDIGEQETGVTGSGQEGEEGDEWDNDGDNWDDEAPTAVGGAEADGQKTSAD